MIQQNKYSDRTIHVANCLLRDDDIGEWIEEARREVAEWQAGNQEADNDILAAELEDRLAAILQDAAEQVMFTTVFGSDSFCCSFQEYDDACYAEPATLFVPAICQYMNQVCWEGVAELVLEHAPVAA